MNDQAIKAFCDDLDRYGVDRETMHDALDDISRAAPHDFMVGDRVRSQLSGRIGVVRRFTRAIVFVEFDDAPSAWVPHGVLEKIERAPRMLTVGQVVEIIEDMDAAGADAMGVSCQTFARRLILEMRIQEDRS